MNLRALRYFVAIADAGSLTAAATAISIAQPALTRQLRELEVDLGVQLLQRTPRGVLLTPAGVTLYESAQRMLAEATRVRQQLARPQDTSVTTVVLGASPTLARVLLPNLFESCHRSLAGVQVRAREAFTPALLDWLERGMVDMAIVTNPEAGRRLTLHPLLGEPFALVSHKSLHVGPAVSVSQLARIPLLMTSLHRSIVEKQLLPLGGQLNIQGEIDSVDSIRELVMQGHWATIMPVSVFKEPRAAETVVMSEVSGVQLNRLLVLATRTERQDNNALHVVREMIESEFARLARRGVFSFGSGTVPGDIRAGQELRGREAVMPG
ncbi:MAG: LysR family transcriptional regulator [Polaromonas sp.]|uniref:LysR family transcriptional regulator n=1 Tax=Polaromonas sp. TaxID=1869339 RepID=UPI002736FA45|nr:LysR family transcriptional regulator [Polaromonas sp.]MDP3799518.1 LysR family transcriptional regulator [Polaromonas sp.]